MTAEEFLSDWFHRHVKAAPYALYVELVKQLVLLCGAEAEKEGITRRELQAAADGNLKRRIAAAMEDAQDMIVKANKGP